MNCVNADTDCSYWSISTDFKLTILAQQYPAKNITKTFDYTFSSNFHSYGDSEFTRLNLILDPVSGYIINDTVTFKVDLNAEKMFRKKN